MSVRVVYHYIARYVCIYVLAMDCLDVSIAVEKLMDRVLHYGCSSAEQACEFSFRNCCLSLLMDGTLSVVKRVHNATYHQKVVMIDREKPNEVYDSNLATMKHGHCLLFTNVRKR